MKQNLRLKCAKIGLKQVSVITGKNANLPMENKNCMRNRYQIKIDINQKNAIAFILKCFVHMDNDVYLYMI